MDWSVLDQSISYLKKVGTVLATVQVMEKTTPHIPNDSIERRRIMARRNTGVRQQFTPPDRSVSRGVLYARRRTQKISISASVVVISLISIACVALFFTAVSGAMAARSRKASDGMASLPTATAFSAATDLKGSRSILLLGSDQRPNDSGYRTDVILYITIDSDKQKISIISFPRDLWVRVPGLYEMKINQVHALGGYDAVAALFEDNFGIRPDYFVLTNFEGFTGIIDSLNGVDVQIAQELTDDCDLPQAVDGDCTVYPGVSHMDGATALWYVRSRHTSSDYDRMRRMQEVSFAIFSRLMSLNAISHLPDLYDSYQDMVQTNVKVQDALPLLPLAKKAFDDSSIISRYAIDEDYATESWSWDGMWILLPDEAAINQLIREAGAK